MVIGYLLLSALQCRYEEGYWEVVDYDHHTGKVVREPCERMEEWEYRDWPLYLLTGLWTNRNCHGAAASDPWGRPEGWASDMGTSW